MTLLAPTAKFSSLCTQQKNETLCSFFHVVVTESKTCSPEAFQCPGSHMCVPQRWKCDGDKDCPDGADESVKAGCSKQDAKPTLTSNPQKFPCPGSLKTCLSFPRSVYTNSTCDPENEFMCQNRQCIPKHFVCDLDVDCSDGSDESPECGERTGFSLAMIPLVLMSAPVWSRLHPFNLKLDVVDNLKKQPNDIYL